MISPNSCWLEFEKLSDSDPPLPDDDLLARLLKSNSCYEAIPVSGRLIVFDQELLMWRAFILLVNSESRRVLLSDSKKNGAITGILSVTDFIRIILKMFREKDCGVGTKIDDLGKITIRRFREFVHKAGKLKKLVSISSEDSLLNAVRILATYRVHSLPVIDPISGNPITVLTYKRILNFIWTFGRNLFHHDHFTKSVKELDIGTWGGVRVVYPDTTLIDCLDILVDLGISGVPVVERETHRVLDVYSRFDAIGVALHSEGLMLLHASVKDALEFKHICQHRCERAISVRDTETFYSVVATFVHHKVHRVCVVDESGVMQGIVSLSDVMKALVLEPAKYMRSRSLAPRRVSQQSFDLSNMELYIRSLSETEELERPEVYEKPL